MMSVHLKQKNQNFYMRDSKMQARPVIHAVEETVIVVARCERNPSTVNFHRHKHTDIRTHALLAHRSDSIQNMFVRYIVLYVYR